MRRQNVVVAVVTMLVLVGGNPWGDVPRADAQTYPTLSIPASYSDLRIVKNVTATPGSASITIVQGTTAGDFELSSPTITVTPSSGIVKKTRTNPIPFSFGWTDTSSLGPQTTGLITLAGHTPDPDHDEMSVDGAVVANRWLTVDRIGTDTVPVRVMRKYPVPTTIRSGTDTTYDTDNYATRLNTVPNAKGSGYDGNGMMAIYHDDTPLPQFNAPNQSEDIDVIFYRKGIHDTSYDLAPEMLADGEVKAAGAVVNPLNLDYYVNVLEQRKLKLTVKKFKKDWGHGVTATGDPVKLFESGDLLKGAVISENFVAVSKNDLQWLTTDSVTHVNIAAGGITLEENGPIDFLNTLTVGETLINTTDDSGVNVPLTGQFTEYTLDPTTLKMKKLKMKTKKKLSENLLTVTTVEDPSVGDTKSYKDLKINLVANVGIAKKVWKKPKNDPLDFGDSVADGRYKEAKMTHLYAAISAASGWKMTNLASKVQPKNTLADPAIGDAVFVRGEKQKKLFKLVGSEAEIVESTEFSHDAPQAVCMNWRARTYGEAYYAKKYEKTTGETLPDEDLMPDNCDWLTSDVVKISDGSTGGIPDDVYYVLQMTFDNRINIAFDGPENGKVVNEFPGLYIAQLNQSTEEWEKPSGPSYFWSLNTFFANKGHDLASLVGSWGVDPASPDDGTGHSWVIMKGTGSPQIFAVVAEPSTLVLLDAGALILLAFLWQRRRRRLQRLDQLRGHAVSVVLGS